MPMLRQLRTVIIVNLILILFFILVNYGIWNMYNHQGLTYSWWNPLTIQIDHAGTIINGQFIPTCGTTISPNYIFILFFVSTAANLYFIIKLQRSKETKQNPS